MAYASAAVYDAVVAIQGGYEPYGPGVSAAAGASTDAAVVEAGYRTLVNYFPGQAAALGSLYAEALGAIPAGAAKNQGQAVGLAAAMSIISLRAGDGRITPGNLNAVRRFDMPNQLRSEIIHARLWAGLHYHFSGVAGVVLGRNVAKYDLRHAFQPVR